MDMQDRQREIYDILSEIAGEYGGNVYFQPPSNVQMRYPAIRYKLTRIDRDHANNGAYLRHFGYEVTVIDKDPNSPIANNITKLPMCSYNRSYFADNLNHWVFILY